MNGHNDLWTNKTSLTLTNIHRNKEIAHNKLSTKSKIYEKPFEDQCY